MTMRLRWSAMRVLSTSRRAVPWMRLMCGGLLVFCITASSPAQTPQAAKAYRIGFVSPTSPGPTEIAFRQGLRDLGYVEGRNLVFDARYAEGRFERFPELIEEVIRGKADVIMVGSSPGALAAKKATVSIPIVFAGVTDPVGTGIVTTLARPGGNVTGITIGFGESGVAGKWLELIKDSAPKVRQIAVLINPANPVTPRNLDVMRAAARDLQLRLDFFEAREVAQLETVFGSLRESKAQAVVVTNDPFFFNYRAKIVDLIAAMRLPAVYFTSEFVEAGGLLSYGPSVTESYRRATRLVDKILKGAKPAELPVEQPVDFELAVNLRTAKSMQLAIPQVVLVRANKIIE